MNVFHQTALVAATALGLAPLNAHAQESYQRAKHQQHRSDARHHTKAKIVGGLVGGGKGAAIGAGVGAGGGLAANHAREKNDVRKREEYGH